MFHLTVRVAWHDSRWNGRVCRTPSCNSFCVAIDRVTDDAKLAERITIHPALTWKGLNVKKYKKKAE